MPVCMTDVAVLKIRHAFEGASKLGWGGRYGAYAVGVTHADGGWPSGSHGGRKAGSHTESHQPGASSVGFGVVWSSSLSGDIHSRGDTSSRGREAADSSRPAG